MQQTEIVYLERDNRIDLLLKANEVAVDLTSVTRIDLVAGTSTITSANQSGDPIRWAQSGYAAGEVRLTLGGEDLDASPNPYAAHLIVYDASNPGGIVWGSLRILVKDTP